MRQASVTLPLHTIKNRPVSVTQRGKPGRSKGTIVELVLTGTLDDGCEFTAFDCVRLLPPGGGQVTGSK